MLTLEPLPMAEALKFWADKVKIGPKEFAALSAEAKIRAFAVAQIAKGEELNSVYKAIEKAIAQGTTLEQFKKDCAGIFERRGWTGKRAWRVDNIFRTNVQTAYSVGQYKQQWAERDLFDTWMYSAVGDKRTRPTHLAMSGKCWPVEHPVWRKWYPPNGYGCRCGVIAMTKGQAEARGLTVESEDITNRLIEPIDPTTGNKGPAVQMLPDPGFAFNPGETYWGNLGEVLAERAERWHPRIAKQLLSDNMQSDEFGLYLKRPKDIYPALRLNDDLAKVVGASTPVAVLREAELLPLLKGGIGAAELAKLPGMDISRTADNVLELSGQGYRAVFVVIEGRLILTEMEKA